MRLIAVYMLLTPLSGSEAMCEVDTNLFQRKMPGQDRLSERVFGIQS